MMWMSLLRGGLKGLASGSQHAGVAIGEGLSEAAKSYDEGLKEMKKNQLAYAKERADLAKSKRQEGVAAVTLAEKLYSNEATLAASLEKAIASGSMNSYVRYKVEAAQEAGDPRSIKTIAAEAATEYAKIMAALEPKTAAAAAQGTSAQAATRQAGTAETKAGTDADIRRDEIARKRDEDKRKEEEFKQNQETEARKAVADMLKRPTSALRQRLRDEPYEQVFNDLLRIQTGKKPSSPPSGFKPQGSGQLPPGFQLVR
jgi:hypothetical protein